MCAVHGFASASYIVEEGGTLETTFGLNIKGSTGDKTMTLKGNITSTANVSSEKYVYVCACMCVCMCVCTCV